VGNTDADAVNNGSYDFDGGPVTLDLSPAGPYPLGDTTVTLTVTDSDSESDSCEATVTVITANLSDFAIVGQNSVFISSRGKIKGDKNVASNGTLTLLGYAGIEGITQSIGAVELASNARIFNNVTTNSTLTTRQRSRIQGDINAGGPVTLGANTIVIGNVTSADAVNVSPYASVSGTIKDFDSPDSAIAVSLPTCTVPPVGTDKLTTPKNSGPISLPPDNIKTIHTEATILLSLRAVTIFLKPFSLEHKQQLNFEVQQRYIFPMSSHSGIISNKSSQV
jgi:cytoskeletal protein CcmA (bactofilin family)